MSYDSDDEVLSNSPLDQNYCHCTSILMIRLIYQIPCKLVLHLFHGNHTLTFVPLCKSVTWCKSYGHVFTSIHVNESGAAYITVTEIGCALFSILFSFYFGVWLF